MKKQCVAVLMTLCLSGMVTAAQADDRLSTIVPIEDPNAAFLLSPEAGKAANADISEDSEDYSLTVEDVSGEIYSEEITPPRDIPMIEPIGESKSHEDVTFVTGGVGAEERAFIEATKGDYNLHITNASETSAFVDDARVSIYRANADEQMLDVTAGPLLYVRLPAGNYTLLAVKGTQTIRQNFKAPKKGAPAKLVLTWKAKKK